MPGTSPASLQPRGLCKAGGFCQLRPQVPGPSPPSAYMPVQHKALSSEQLSYGNSPSDVAFVVHGYFPKFLAFPGEFSWNLCPPWPDHEKPGSDQRLDVYSL